MKKGIGGGLDIVHSFVIMGIAVFLISYGLGGNVLSPLFLIILSVILVILEIVALAG